MRNTDDRVGFFDLFSEFVFEELADQVDGEKRDIDSDPLPAELLCSRDRGATTESLRFVLVSVSTDSQPPFPDPMKDQTGDPIVVNMQSKAPES